MSEDKVDLHVVDGDEKQKSPADLVHDSAMLMLEKQNVEDSFKRRQYWINFMLVARNMSMDNYRPKDIGDAHVFHVILDKLFEVLFPLMDENPDVALDIGNVLTNTFHALSEANKRMGELP
jgi:hypothetical protein